MPATTTWANRHGQGAACSPAFPAELDLVTERTEPAPQQQLSSSSVAAVFRNTAENQNASADAV